MMLPQSSWLLVASLLAALPANADGLYTKKSPVLQLNQKTYGSLIANSNYTSIVEFYAPWCGHCKNLKPAYEKAAQNLNGLAKVAAVNCDDDEIKPFCGQMGVQGFPTLKIVTPSKKPGKPRVEDYQGARTAKAIVDAVVDRIPNHVKRATDKDLDKWLGQNEERPKAILFTEKGTTTPLIRALAIDFLGAIDVAQVRDKESASVERFGVSEFPTLVVVSGNEEPKVYEGELKKQPITDFLKQFASPNPDATGEAASPAAKPKKSKPSKPAKAAPKVPVVPDDEDKSTAAEETPQAKAAHVPIVPPIPTLATPESLESACLSSKSTTCVLALLPATSEPDSALPSAATDALSSLAEIAHKHAQRGMHLFPIYGVPEINSASQKLRTALGLEGDDVAEIIAVNARRGWYRRYGQTGDFGLAAVEGWIDAIRLGEGAKEKLPEGIIAEPKAEKPEEEEPEHDEL
ncbi:Putative PDI related protein A [Penicillium brasilianum]|uniref:protein disulfide-isomerase n=1 Tax=Penicillium brasilianum TaxID=104259 RepID=A0A0F7TBQ8_PENBI|nr:Putative PDI related protein A [Penicillium brasilianum]